MNRSSKPLITVIIATYNASHTLQYTIRSVLDSDYDHFELLVIGDCCTDDTEQCVASFRCLEKRYFYREFKKNHSTYPFFRVSEKFLPVEEKL